MFAGTLWAADVSREGSAPKIAVLALSVALWLREEWFGLAGYSQPHDLGTWERGGQAQNAGKLAF